MRCLWVALLLLAEISDFVSPLKHSDGSSWFSENTTNVKDDLQPDLLPEEDIPGSVNVTNAGLLVGGNYNDGWHTPFRGAWFSASLPGSCTVFKGQIFEFTVNHIHRVGANQQILANVFTIQEEGYYMFTWTFFYNINTQLCLNLMVNRNIITIVYGITGPDNVHSTTGTVIAKVSKGDTVYLEESTLNGCKPYGYILSDDFRKSSFNGFKIGEL